MTDVTVRVRALLLLVPLVLAACSASPDRAAAPAEATESAQVSLAPASASPAPAGERVGASGNLGVRVCVKNPSSGKAYVHKTKTFSTNEMIDVLDPADNPNGETCAEGKSTVGNDVEGYIEMVPASRTIDFWGNNPWLGSPGAVAYQNGTGGCSAGNANMSAGKGFAFDDGRYKVSVVRQQDSSDYKEFVILIQDSATPSADGSLIACTYPQPGKVS